MGRLELLGPAHLHPECFLLLGEVRTVPVQVDPDLAHRAIRAGIQQLLHLRQRGGRVRIHRTGMKTHHHPAHRRELFRHGMHGRNTVGIDVRQQKALHTGIHGTLHHFRTVTVELLVVEVCVGIDEHGSCGLCAAKVPVAERIRNPPRRAIASDPPPSRKVSSTDNTMDTDIPPEGGMDTGSIH